MSHTGKNEAHQSDVLKKHMSLVRAIAYQIKVKLPAHVELDDLIQAGMIGLLDALLKYEEDTAQFSTYATQRIRGAILDDLRASDLLPRQLRKMIRQIEHATNRLEQSLQRLPSGQEVAAHVGIDLDSFHRSVSDYANAQLSSIEFNSDEENDRHFIDTQSDTSDSLDHLIAQRFNESLQSAIQNLPEREKCFMSLYYERDLLLKEIAEIMGISESRASQLHGQAVNHLRKSLKEIL